MKGNLKAELFPLPVVTEPSQHIAADGFDSSQEGGKGSWLSMEARKAVEKTGKVESGELGGLRNGRSG